MNTRKGISPLIATLLLIAIAVAASVLTYSWVMSMVGSQSAQAQTQLRIESVNWLRTGTGSTDPAAGWQVQVRNTGSVATNIESVSIRENKAGASTTTLLTSPAANLANWKTGETFSYDVGVSDPLEVVATTSGGYGFTWAKGTSYVIRVTAATGFFYEMVATSPAV
jgi:flagellin-like protein